MVMVIVGRSATCTRTYPNDRQQWLQRIFTFSVESGYRNQAFSIPWLDLSHLSNVMLFLNNSVDRGPTQPPRDRSEVLKNNLLTDKSLTSVSDPCSTRVDV